jgi:hypothetical protein
MKNIKRIKWLLLIISFVLALFFGTKLNALDTSSTCQVLEEADDNISMLEEDYYLDFQAKTQEIFYRDAKSLYYKTQKVNFDYYILEPEYLCKKIFNQGGLFVDGTNEIKNTKKGCCYNVNYESLQDGDQNKTNSLTCYNETIDFCKLRVNDLNKRYIDDFVLDFKTQYKDGWYGTTEEVGLKDINSDNPDYKLVPESLITFTKTEIPVEFSKDDINISKGMKEDNTLEILVPLVFKATREPGFVAEPTDSEFDCVNEETGSIDSACLIDMSGVNLSELTTDMLTNLIFKDNSSEADIKKRFLEFLIALGYKTIPHVLNDNICSIPYLSANTTLLVENGIGYVSNGVQNGRCSEGTIVDGYFKDINSLDKGKLLDQYLNGTFVSENKNELVDGLINNNDFYLYFVPTSGSSHGIEPETIPPKKTALSINSGGYTFRQLYDLGFHDVNDKCTSDECILGFDWFQEGAGCGGFSFEQPIKIGDVPTPICNLLTHVKRTGSTKVYAKEDVLFTYSLDDFMLAAPYGQFYNSKKVSTKVYGLQAALKENYNDNSLTSEKVLWKMLLDIYRYNGLIQKAKMGKLTLNDFSWRYNFNDLLNNSSGNQENYLKQLNKEWSSKDYITNQNLSKLRKESKFEALKRLALRDILNMKESESDSNEVRLPMFEYLDLKSEYDIEYYEPYLMNGVGVNSLNNNAGSNSISGLLKDYSIPIAVDANYNITIFVSGDYIFSFQVDNYGSIYVDDVKLSDSSEYGWPSSVSVSKNLIAGNHKITLNGYDEGGLNGMAAIVKDSAGNIIWDTRKGQYYPTCKDNEKLIYALDTSNNNHPLCISLNSMRYLNSNYLENNITSNKVNFSFNEVSESVDFEYDDVWGGRSFPLGDFSTWYDRDFGIVCRADERGTWGLNGLWTSYYRSGGWFHGLCNSGDGTMRGNACNDTSASELLYYLVGTHDELNNVKCKKKICQNGGIISNNNPNICVKTNSILVCPAGYPQDNGDNTCSGIETIELDSGVPSDVYNFGRMLTENRIDSKFEYNLENGVLNINNTLFTNIGSENINGILNNEDVRRSIGCVNYNYESLKIENSVLFGYFTCFDNLGYLSHLNKANREIVDSTVSFKQQKVKAVFTDLVNNIEFEKCKISMSNNVPQLIEIIDKKDIGSNQYIRLSSLNENVNKTFRLYIPEEKQTTKVKEKYKDVLYNNFLSYNNELFNLINPSMFFVKNEKIKDFQTYLEAFFPYEISGNRETSIPIEYFKEDKDINEGILFGFIKKYINEDMLNENERTFSLLKKYDLSKKTDIQNNENVYLLNIKPIEGVYNCNGITNEKDCFLENVINKKCNVLNSQITNSNVLFSEAIGFNVYEINELISNLPSSQDGEEQNECFAYNNYIYAIKKEENLLNVKIKYKEDLIVNNTELINGNENSVLSQKKLKDLSSVKELADCNLLKELSSGDSIECVDNDDLIASSSYLLYKNGEIKEKYSVDNNDSSISPFQLKNIFFNELGLGEKMKVEYFNVAKNILKVLTLDENNESSPFGLFDYLLGGDKYKIAGIDETLSETNRIYIGTENDQINNIAKVLKENNESSEYYVYLDVITSKFSNLAIEDDYILEKIIDQDISSSKNINKYLIKVKVDKDNDGKYFIPLKLNEENKGFVLIGSVGSFFNLKNTNNNENNYYPIFEEKLPFLEIKNKITKYNGLPFYEIKQKELTGFSTKRYNRYLETSLTPSKPFKTYFSFDVSEFNTNVIKNITEIENSCMSINKFNSNVSKKVLDILNQYTDLINYVYSYKEDGIDPKFGNRLAILDAINGNINRYVLSNSYTYTWQRKQSIKISLKGISFPWNGEEAWQANSRLTFGNANVNFFNHINGTGYFDLLLNGDTIINDETNNVSIVHKAFAASDMVSTLYGYAIPAKCEPKSIMDRIVTQKRHCEIGIKSKDGLVSELILGIYKKRTNFVKQILGLYNEKVIKSCINGLQGEGVYDYPINEINLEKIFNMQNVDNKANLLFDKWDYNSSIGDYNLTYQKEVLDDKIVHKMTQQGKLNENDSITYCNSMISKKIPVSSESIKSVNAYKYLYGLNTEGTEQVLKRVFLNNDFQDLNGAPNKLQETACEKYASMGIICAFKNTCEDIMAKTGIDNTVRDSNGNPIFVQGVVQCKNSNHALKAMSSDISSCVNTNYSIIQAILSPSSIAKKLKEEFNSIIFEQRITCSPNGTELLKSNDVDQKSIQTLFSYNGNLNKAFIFEGINIENMIKDKDTGTKRTLTSVGEMVNTFASYNADAIDNFLQGTELEKIMSSCIDFKTKYSYNEIDAGWLIDSSEKSFYRNYYNKDIDYGYTITMPNGEKLVKVVKDCSDILNQKTNKVYETLSSDTADLINDFYKKDAIDINAKLEKETIVVNDILDNNDSINANEVKKVIDERKLEQIKEISDKNIEFIETVNSIINNESATTTIIDEDGGISEILSLDSTDKANFLVEKKSLETTGLNLSQLRDTILSENEDSMNSVLNSNIQNESQDLNKRAFSDLLGKQRDKMGQDFEKLALLATTAATIYSPYAGMFTGVVFTIGDLLTKMDSMKMEMDALQEENFGKMSNPSLEMDAGYISVTNSGRFAGKTSEERVRKLKEEADANKLAVANSLKEKSVLTIDQDTKLKELYGDNYFKANEIGKDGKALYTKANAPDINEKYNNIKSKYGGFNIDNGSINSFKNNLTGGKLSGFDTKLQSVDLVGYKQCKKDNLRNNINVDCDEEYYGMSGLKNGLDDAVNEFKNKGGAYVETMNGLYNDPNNTIIDQNKSHNKKLKSSSSNVGIEKQLNKIDTSGFNLNGDMDFNNMGKIEGQQEKEINTFLK